MQVFFLPALSPVAHGEKIPLPSLKKNHPILLHVVACPSRSSQGTVWKRPSRCWTAGKPQLPLKSRHPTGKGLRCDAVRWLALPLTALPRPQLPVTPVPEPSDTRGRSQTQVQSNQAQRKPAVRLGVLPSGVLGQFKTKPLLRAALSPRSSPS